MGGAGTGRNFTTEDTDSTEKKIEIGKWKLGKRRTKTNAEDAEDAEYAERRIGGR
jgi:hypothetical protein